jgi:hypothetical protein
VQAMITRVRNNGRFWPGRSTCYSPGSTGAPGLPPPVGESMGHVPPGPDPTDHDTGRPWPPPLLPHGGALRDTILGVELLVLPGAGHDLPRPVWETFGAALLGHTS